MELIFYHIGSAVKFIWIFDFVSRIQRQKNEFLLYQKIENFSRLVDVDLHQRSSVREPKSVALHTLGHENVFDLEKDLRLNSRLRAKIFFFRIQFFEARKSDDVERGGGPSSDGRRDELSALFVANVVHARRVDGPPVGHGLRQGGEIAQILFPLGPELGEEGDTRKQNINN